MPTWAVIGDVSARCSYAVFTAVSKPTIAQVEQWIDEAEGKTRGVLAAQGLPTAYTDDDAVNMLKTAAADYAEGHSRKVWEEHERGDALIARFDKFIEDLRARTVQLGGELALGDVAEAAAGPRSYWTDNEDNLSIANGDFDPQITTDWKD